MPVIKLSLFFFNLEFTFTQTFQVARVVKNLPPSAGDIERCRFDLWVRMIPWRKAWQTNSSILAWRIPWTKEPGVLQSIML